MLNANSSEERDYIPLADHALIGNLRTAALVSVDGSIESYCVPHFDSPSIFARILDKHKGGHFALAPAPRTPFDTKQAYLPASNVLQTKFLNEHGVAAVTDFLPRKSKGADGDAGMLFWLVRKVEVIRGTMPLRMECAPAFNYARDPHEAAIVPDNSIPGGGQDKVIFCSPSLDLDLRYVPASSIDDVPAPTLRFELLDLTRKGHLGMSACANMTLHEGQSVTFVLRHAQPEDKDTSARLAGLAERVHAELASALAGDGAPEHVVDNLHSGTSRLRAPDDPLLTPALVNALLTDTNAYWTGWIRRSTYRGSWKEAVHRSALALKLLIFEPTGAVVASPTFSLPEYIGGTRNWDYRASWIRDASFTLYALIRLGFTREANAYVDFILERIKDKNADGSLQIMYTIHGSKVFPELELAHLDGHKGSKPVRIGNGAIDHVQLDIYGELMDCIYLGQKFGRPLVDYVVANYNEPDLSIWEVRNKKRHFTYSKVMMWVAIDRGLRLADKRSLPCPHRGAWLAARDELYEQVMARAWDAERGFFGQSYEEKHVLDSAVLIMPLVFFISAPDPRFISTLHQILKTPQRGGLTSNNLVYRYDVSKADDGVGGEEGTFCLCTLWCVEALTRAGEYDKALLQRSVAMFEDFLQYLNHVGLCTEEISDAGEALGNAVQGFTHVTLISAAYNLSRTLEKYHF